MIEIQCTSCHTRYRIDERVLPPDSPTFKCSRCGHVFTTDPLTAKKAGPSPTVSPKPRSSNPRTPKPDSTASPAESVPSPTAAPPRSEASEPLPLVVAKPLPLTPEAKSAPIKPYIRNPRPATFSPSPEPAPQKEEPEPSTPVDTFAVARMKASMNTPPVSPKALDDWEPRHHVPKAIAGDETPQLQPQAEPAEGPEAAPSRDVPTGRADEEGTLEFDFNEDTDPELGTEPPDDDLATSPKSWSVGEETLESPVRQPAEFVRDEPDLRASRSEIGSMGRGASAPHADIAPIQRSALPDERAYIERAALRSARTFVGLFFVVALVFAALTLVTVALPSASAELLRRMPIIGPAFVQPTPLENLVSVSDVQSNYQTVKGGHQALVLTGVVKNNATLPLHTIQIGVRLLDAAQHEVASFAVYVGTTLSPRMIGEMTPHELEFLQKLDPQKTFVLEPGHAAPFLMVFIDPPRDAGHFAVAVSNVQPPAVEKSQQQASTRD
jgi:predicted Zn finger-like uncharacterized protein